MRGAPLAAALILLTVAPGASAATGAGGASLLTPQRSALVSSPAHPVDDAAARAVAARAPKIAEQLRRHPGATFSTSRKDGGRWQVDLFAPVRGGHPARQIGQVYVSSATGEVLEAWTGFQVAWTMARGYPGAFGRAANTTWLWVGLCVLFVAPFVDPRRPLRWLHADLLALTGLSVSYAFFNDANLGISVPLSALPLAYLLGRLLWIGLGRGRPPEPLRLLVPWQWLAIATLFLLGFRLGLNALDGNVIDVGYAGVIGADKLAHGRSLYGSFPADNLHGDTYGPLLYLAYVPFELLWPWHHHWDDLPAAHAAAGAFDLASVGLLFLIGRRLAGPALGAVLAYAWVTYPFTLLATNSGTNDALPAVLVLLALWLHRRPLARGAAIAAAGLTKFAPLALLPLLLTHDAERGSGRASGAPLRAAVLGAALVAAFALALVLASGDLRSFWDSTVAYQAERDAPFSPWGLYGGGWRVAQQLFQVATIVLAVGLVFVPRRDDLVGLAALCGAVLLATQLATTYWFYLYVVWALPGLLIGLVGGRVVPAPVRAPRAARARAAARSPSPAAAPGS